MGAIRVALPGGGEDVFTDEQVGDDGVVPGMTLFDFRFEVSACRALTVSLVQLFRDRRYCPQLRPVGGVQVAHYRPTEWVTVTKE